MNSQTSGRTSAETKRSRWCRKRSASRQTMPLRQIRYCAEREAAGACDRRVHGDAHAASSGRGAGQRDEGATHIRGARCLRRPRRHRPARARGPGAARRPHRRARSRRADALPTARRRRARATSARTWREDGGARRDIQPDGRLVEHAGRAGRAAGRARSRPAASGRPTDLRTLSLRAVGEADLPQHVAERRRAPRAGRCRAARRDRADCP